VLCRKGKRGRGSERGGKEKGEKRERKREGGWGVGEGGGYVGVAIKGRGSENGVWELLVNH